MKLECFLEYKIDLFLVSFFSLHQMGITYCEIEVRIVTV